MYMKVVDEYREEVYRLRQKEFHKSSSICLFAALHKEWIETNLGRAND